MQLEANKLTFGLQDFKDLKRLQLSQLLQHAVKLERLDIYSLIQYTDVQALNLFTQHDLQAPPLAKSLSKDLLTQVIDLNKRSPALAHVEYRCVELDAPWGHGAYYVDISVWIVQKATGGWTCYSSRAEDHEVSMWPANEEGLVNDLSNVLWSRE